MDLDHELHRLLVRAANGALRDDLAPEENLKLGIAFMSMLRVYEARYLQVRLGVLDVDILERMAGSSRFFEYPWFRASWKSVFEPSVGADFASFFRDRFGIE